MMTRVSLDAARRFAALAAVAVPLTVVAVLKTIGTLQPAPSMAQLQDEFRIEQAAPARTESDVHPLTFDTAAVQGRQRARQLRVLDAAQLPNPFLYAPDDAPVGLPEPAPDVPETAPIVAPELQISGFMSGHVPMVIINGQLHRIGDSVVPGWTIRSIDPEAQTVTLAGPQNTTRTFSAARY